jgi:hypothetical protein
VALPIPRVEVAQVGLVEHVRVRYPEQQVTDRVKRLERLDGIE